MTSPKYDVQLGTLGSVVGSACMRDVGLRVALHSVVCLFPP